MGPATTILGLNSYHLARQRGIRPVMLGGWSEAAAPAGTVSSAALPGGPGQPSAPTTWGCLRWLDAGLDEGRRKLPGSEPAEGRFVRPRKHGPEVKNRRRGAPRGERVSTEARPCLTRRGLTWCASRCSTPPRVWRGERFRRTRRRGQNHRAMTRGHFGLDAETLFRTRAPQDDGERLR